VYLDDLWTIPNPPWWIHEIDGRGMNIVSTGPTSVTVCVAVQPDATYMQFYRLHSPPVQYFWNLEELSDKTLRIDKVVLKVNRERKTLEVQR
jgi:hypothetical protein